ncbi:MAG: flagellar basal body-associated FliL family protein [Planctomycetota bacterium]
MIKFQPMTVNMRGSPRRFLRVALGMETTYQKVVEELEKPSPQVADFLIDKLSNVDTSDVDTTTGRNKLKREILAGVNETLQLLEVEGYVSNVYFVEFVIQSQ